MQLPSEDALRDIVQRYGQLLVRLGNDLGKRPMVLPNAKSFPDPFRGDEPSVKRLVERMQAHAGMDDIPIQTRLLRPDDGGDGADCSTGGSCSTGGCCAPSAGTPKGLQRLTENPSGDGWVLQFDPLELRHSVALTASVARALANVFLLETLVEGQTIENPVEVTNDLVAVALGFGSLMMNGAYIYAKSCGGPSVQRVTSLGVGELAMAFALFTAHGGYEGKLASRELGVTQRELFDEARGWVEPNKELVRALQEHPATLAEGHFRISEPTPWLLRVLGVRKHRKERDPLDGYNSLEDVAAELVASRPKQAAPPDPKRDELRALVDEALSESKGG